MIACSKRRKDKEKAEAKIPLLPFGFLIENRRLKIES
jgi:hypothetical protein